MPALEPLGDQGVLARFGDESEALAWAARVRQLEADWLLDVVGAYSTVAVFHDRDRLSLDELVRALEGIDGQSGLAAAGASHVIPCCYDLGPDLERIARHTGLPRDEVVRLHSSAEYVVYAIGFCPGFPYLGYLPTPLCGVPRLESPRLRVEPGSVGLTGRQTGIYTEPRPAGWNLVGRTPLELVDVAAGYFPLRTGDRVRFAPISEAEFRRLEGRRL
jgi:inhibitor of KinA